MCYEYRFLVCLVQKLYIANSRMLSLGYKTTASLLMNRVYHRYEAKETRLYVLLYLGDEGKYKSEYSQRFF